MLKKFYFIVIFCSFCFISLIPPLLLKLYQKLNLLKLQPSENICVLRHNVSNYKTAICRVLSSDNVTYSYLISSKQLDYEPETPTGLYPNDWGYPSNDPRSSQ